MFDPHPPLASFAPSIIVLILLLELLNLCSSKYQLRTVIKIISVIGMAAISAAFISGYFAGEAPGSSFKIPDEAYSRHHLAGRLSLIAYFPFLVSGLIYNENSGRIFKLCYFLSLALVISLSIFTACLGGGLVFDYGAGVRLIHVDPN